MLGLSALRSVPIYFKVQAALNGLMGNMMMMMMTSAGCTARIQHDQSTYTTPNAASLQYKCTALVQSLLCCPAPVPILVVTQTKF
jgi:hypothetical protein